MTERIFNFSSGPAVLPLPVLEQVQRDLVALPGVGMSVMEISHRSATFEAIIAKAEADIRKLANVPEGYKVLFLQGGASLQFSMVPLNLLTEGQTADYLMTGTWADKAAKEARRVGTVHETGSTAADGYSRIPTDAECELTPGAAYVHMTSNNTIEGTQWHRLPEVGDAPLVSDASSDIFSGPIDISKYGLIYAGAQKNLGPSGVTLVIIREDLLARSSQVAAHDAQLRRPGRERLALQHAARLRDLRPGAGDRVAARPGRPAGDRRDQRAQGRQAVRGARPDRASGGRPPRRTAGA